MCVRAFLCVWGGGGGGYFCVWDVYVCVVVGGGGVCLCVNGRGIHVSPTECRTTQGGV